MNKQFEERMRKALLVRRAALVENDAELGEDKQGLRDNDDVDLADQGQREAADDVIMTLDDQDRREVEEIDAALGRMADGQYGICSECDEEIPEERLEVMPEARSCAGCSEEMRTVQAAS